MEFNSPMARQFNGPVIDSLLHARHNVFNESEAFMLHRQGLTLENATTEELDLIGKFLCMPRPYAMVNDVPEYCDDAFYRIYIQNLALLRQSQSIYDLARMFDQFMPDGRYFIAFLPDGDLLVVIDEQYNTYVPFFQKALDSVFTALPRINALTSWDFDKFVYQHRLYTRLISLKNSDWEFGIEYRSHACLWLAVGRDSSGGCVVESTDGIHWYKQTNSITFESLNDIHYADNKWVAVGYGHVYVSEDGRTWNAYLVGNGSCDLIAIHYHEGLWIAVGTRNYRFYVCTSTDLEHWTEPSLPSEISYAGASFNDVSYVNGYWIAVGTNNIIITSEDGVTWAKVNIYGSDIWECVGDIGGTALVAGSSGNAVISSNPSNPNSWSRIYDLNYGHDLNAICKNEDSYVVVGNYGTVIEGSSSFSWTVRTTEQISAVFADIDYFNGKWGVVAEQRGIYTSTDLVHWTSHSVENASIQQLNAIACVPIDIREGTYATVVSPSGKLTVDNHIATATIERRT